MARVEDAHRANYLVAYEHTEYEAGFHLFISYDLAIEKYNKYKEQGVEVYFANLVADSEAHNEKR